MACGIHLGSSRGGRFAGWEDARRADAQLSMSSLDGFLVGARCSMDAAIHKLIGLGEAAEEEEEEEEEEKQEAEQGEMQEAAAVAAVVAELCHVEEGTRRC